jgi:hypothetical protein
MSKIRVIGNLDYVQGYLKYGHLELEIDKEEWSKMSKENQEEYLIDCGELVIDDWEVNDRGDLNDIVIEEI